MTACSSCGRDLPEDAPFCPACGAPAGAFTFAQATVSPSHFNTGVTATAPPAQPAEPAAPAAYSELPSAFPEERKKPFFARRGVMLAIIGLLAIFLLGTAFETGMLGSPGGPSGPLANSASDPLTAEQLYNAYASNPTQAGASYTNKTVYIKDVAGSLERDLGTGQYFSYLDSGEVVLFWGGQAQVGQLYPGATFVAKCSVTGVESSPVAGEQLYLQDCDLVSVQSQSTTSTTSSISVSANND